MRLAIATLIVFCAAISPAIADAPAKPRIVVMTDIGGDPDDEQSLVRFLLYSCDFDVEGLCTGFGHGHYQKTRPDLLHKAVDAYAKVHANLARHRDDYPTPDAMRALIKDGSNGDAHSVGDGRDSDASNWIIRVLEKDDERPVWFSIWGGPRELAQALWKMQRTMPAERFAAIKKKIRVHSIADQDNTAAWIKKQHPDVFYIYSRNVFRGVYRGGDESLVSAKWAEANVLEDHGALGAIYPGKAAGKDGVKEGDTPSFLYVVPNGLSDPERPDWGSWGGRFERRANSMEFTDAKDTLDGKAIETATVYRWRRAYQNDFAARLDWCVQPPERANHAPIAVCNGSSGVGVVHVKAKPGERVALTAVGSSDRDVDTLAYRWWVYREPSTHRGEAKIEAADRAAATLIVPDDATGKTIHVVLEVTDGGEPALTAYRRVVVSVER